LRLAIIGLGLIGGSIARAIRSGRTESSIDSIVAWSPTGSGPAAALADGVIDRTAVSLADALDGAQLVVLATDPLSCLELLDKIAATDLPGEPPTITDVASTKAAIVKRADRLRLSFVGGHPMAGLESSGYGHSRSDLFEARPWVICPGAQARPIDLERVGQLVTGCGAQAHRISAGEHDRAVAAISHLPLALAAALVQAVSDGDDWPIARALAAGGWSSATRLARGDVAMGAGIAATNGPELARRIRAMLSQLDGWLADLEATPDDPGATAQRIAVRLQAARESLGPTA
jgi:prephenate dehydrogenase